MKLIIKKKKVVFSILIHEIRHDKDKLNEEKQEMMEKALDLLEVADKFWEKGDIENTLNTLDEAYALLSKC